MWWQSSQKHRGILLLVKKENDLTYAPKCRHLYKTQANTITDFTITFSLLDSFKSSIIMSPLFRQLLQYFPLCVVVNDVEGSIRSETCMRWRFFCYLIKITAMQNLFRLSFLLKVNAYFSFDWLFFRFRNLIYPPLTSTPLYCVCASSSVRIKILAFYGDILCHSGAVFLGF